MCQYGVFRRNLTNICIYKEKQRREMVLLGDLYCVRKNANEVHNITRDRAYSKMSTECTNVEGEASAKMRTKCRIVIKMGRAQE